MKQLFSRRDLLKGAVVAAGYAALSAACRLLGLRAPGATAQAPELTPRAFLPLVMKGSGSPPPQDGRVVHVYAAAATSWNFSTGWYGNYVDQNVVNEMVDQGLMRLTGTESVPDAWRALLPAYQPGQRIAIKVNFNNCNSCTDSDNIIDGLIHPVNGLIRGMKQIGVREEDIYIYDALRGLPARFRSHCLYPGVHFVDGGGCAEQATFSSTDPNAVVHFGRPYLTDRRIADVVIGATYLINMPIMKDHGISGVTLGFKNHYGTINNIIRGGSDNLHDSIDPGHSSYSPTYSPLLDIYKNPHIQGKTILVVGDGLYGALGNTNVTPSRWATFGNNAPRSLFFSRDPVALDCVMLDILDAEPTYHPKRPGADDYLQLAAAAGLGIYERGDPWGSGYSQIDYQRVNL